MIETVLKDRQPLPRPSRRSGGDGQESLEPRDRAFAHLIAMTVLRRHGSLKAVLGRFITKSLPDTASRAQAILLSGVAQILLVGTPPHAAINLAVEQCRRDRTAHRYAGLINAVLRRVASDGPAILATLEPAEHDVPSWLLRRWTEHYGAEAARRIALASLAEPPLDISVKSDPALWAERLGGTLLPTGSVRLADAGRIEELAGFSEGAWWIQDAAAALPARLLGDVDGKEVADLCAAPGGKTAALAAAGGRVTAVDIGIERLDLVRSNLQRLALADRVDIVAADLEA
jgi:16S rRNA (cytosine967-C5)-methyltransferase